MTFSLSTDFSYFLLFTTLQNENPVGLPAEFSLFRKSSIIYCVSLYSKNGYVIRFIVINKVTDAVKGIAVHLTKNLDRLI